MLRKTKRFLSIIITFALCIVFNYSSYASVLVNTTIENSLDLYCKTQQSEVCVLEGITYTYRYSKDSNGNNVILVESIYGIDKIVTDVQTGEIYLNNTKVGNTKIYENSPLNTLRADDWQHMGDYEQYISWAVGTAIAVVVGMIAAALGVNAAMVFTGASIFAASCTGGTIYWTNWYSNGSKPKLKVSWSFAANTGDDYGPWSFTIAR